MCSIGVLSRGAFFSGETFNVDVKENATVETVKTLIALKAGMDEGDEDMDIFLSSTGEELQDDVTLSSLNLPKDATEPQLEVGFNL
jgi:hypothetical protein|mmetsp:Transcript_16727/g.29196  ORF Transcript_16727/g.29196 Transcript_16727/m.29196 type:complete len:86 (+) Transcript_16727:22-279(+)|eukprot:CAMPEP_0174289602 /NCGR_PEP_ID=MMETSP0809-20121228/25609_1 /TAXON_ID=73025 ORGANISM="Eutreptiella gymnastica-like, Strain CCMP1594" /NCGR_SAMPLE_ID=MMETSP0809 /ASSEMBLY_ACC=CAM_ASM_000658 /LENGTH=85 /DNA_ID=CAMNT_0015387645 /DNA_START=11 /DNA_END=268 /DNA_ORIENTATION=+